MRAVFGGAILIALVVLALFGSAIAPHEHTRQDLRARLLPPVGSAEADPNHLLGTDHLGRDVVSRLIQGARISLSVGIASVLIGVILGGLVGLLSGYFGGLLDSIVMRLADVQLSFPFILLALAVMAVFGPGLRNVIIVLGVTAWVIYARIVRSVILSIRSSDFVLAAKSIGCSEQRIVFRYLTPHVLGPVLALATLDVGQRIVFEAGLSFLGLGVAPPDVSWGTMLADGRVYISTAWWIATLPGICITITVLGITHFGEWLRERVDPLSGKFE